MLTERDIALFLDEVKRYFTKFTIAEYTVRQWHKHLQHCPPKVLYTALEEHACESRFAPALSDIRKIALRLNGGRFYSASHESVNQATARKGIQDALEAGLVPLRDPDRPALYWRNRSDCVRTPAGWISKIDFVMDRLGAGKVNKILRQELYTHNTPKKLAKSIKDFPTEKYQRILNELVQLAMHPPMEEQHESR